MLATYKKLLPVSDQVTETINSLKEYRVAEINKKAQEGDFKKAKTITEETKNTLEDERKVPEKQTTAHKEPDFSYGGRQVSF